MILCTAGSRGSYRVRARVGVSAGALSGRELARRSRAPRRGASRRARVRHGPGSGTGAPERQGCVSGGGSRAEGGQVGGTLKARRRRGKFWAQIAHFQAKLLLGTAHQPSRMASEKHSFT